MAIADVLRWFQDLAQARWHHAYFNKIDCAALRHDAYYGRQLFLEYCGTRKGAPRASVIAGIKAVKAASQRDGRVADHYSTFYDGTLRESHSPALDPNLEQLNVPDIIKDLWNGDPLSAFDQLGVRGAAHKIKALFVRELVCLLNVPTPGWGEDKYLACQPVDEWLRTAIDALPDPVPFVAANPRGLATRYGLSRKDLHRARKLIGLCSNHGLLPLLVNQGVWYFASNIVANAQRLVNLLQRLDPKVLQQELELMDGFLP
jgi:hypothetical protein